MWLDMVVVVDVEGESHRCHAMLDLSDAEVMAFVHEVGRCHENVAAAVVQAAVAGLAQGVEDAAESLFLLPNQPFFPEAAQGVRNRAGRRTATAVIARPSERESKGSLGSCRRAGRTSPKDVR